MSETTRRPALRLTRREALTAAAALVIPHPLWADPPASARFTLPGPFRGKVVEVFHPGSVVEGKVRAEAVSAMMARGMTALTGAPDEASAWKRFFGPGDVVGIKGSPVGKPRSLSQPETLTRVIRGLLLAGVKVQNIVLFERYEVELLSAGFDKLIPEGAQLGYGAKLYDDFQIGLEGYDPAVYAEMPRVMPGVSPDNPIHRRSHLSLVVSQKVNKIVNVCTLKDHASAGITMALKNMSHGMSNNVCRTHPDPDSNWCDTFIPAVVSIPRLREKVVLHVGDGLIGTYDGGPGNWNRHFRTWDYRSLFFATDPVALDRVGWAILDAKRVASGLPKLADTGIKATNPGFEQFARRQPEHVLLAAKAGLGEADLSKIVHQRLRLAG